MQASRENVMIGEAPGLGETRHKPSILRALKQADYSHLSLIFFHLSYCTLIVCNYFLAF